MSAPAHHPRPSRTRRALRAGIRALFAPLVVGLGVLASVLLGEIGLRLIDWRMPGMYDAAGRLHEPADDTGQRGVYPPGRGRLVHFDFDVEWSINRDGFRERQPRPKPPGVWRIGVFGDSFTEGWGVPKEARFASRWFESVRERLPDSELWNFGASHTGAGRQGDFLAGVADGYELDEVVLALYAGNELRDNWRWARRAERQARQLAALDGSHLADGNSPLPPVSARRPDRRWARARAWIAENSRVAMLLWFHYASAIVNRIAPGQAAGPRQIERQWPATELALEHFLAAAGDRPVTLWYVPTRTEWDDAYWERVAVHPAVRRSRDLLRHRVERFCREHGVEWIDGTEWLRGLPSERVKFPIDGHFHAEGHARYAEGLVESGRAAWRLRHAPGTG